ncbi:MAG: mechanosensitive ion channel protein MscS [Denitrovibrio sp.]|nr:MAG: mechanosensitive ion channel protein MscS [Denitrovibrio sp.]
MQLNIDTIKQFFLDSSEYSLTFVVAILSYFIVKKVIIKLIHSFFKKTKNKLDDHLLDSKIFGQLALIAPALVIIYAEEILKIPNEIHQIISAFIAFNITIFIIRFFTVINTIYNSFDISNRRPIKGYLQLIQVIIGFLGSIASVYMAVGKSPLGVLSGLGAMTAVLLFVFKDTILSFIAGMQIMFTDLIHKGDWIEVPQFGADGDVIDIALYTVTVQNFDKTIVSIPTSKLLDGSFKNWRGMTEAGGRRIKRSIYLNQASIKFLKTDDITKYKNIKILQPYIDSKLTEDIDTGNQSDINRRKLTNLGTFRAYIREYLKNHPKIRKDMTLLVRQLPSGPDGLPIEIYVFTNDTNWIVYEDIQADIFDHLLAAVNEFDLAIFQHPAGTDMQKLLSSS